jgi:hypothetical protein
MATCDLRPEDKVHAILMASKISEHSYLFVHPNDYLPDMSLNRDIDSTVCISARVLPGTVFMSSSEMLQEDFDMQPLRAPEPGKAGAVALSSLAMLPLEPLPLTEEQKAYGKKLAQRLAKQQK